MLNQAGVTSIQDAVNNGARIGWEVVSVGYDTQGIPITWLFKVAE
jgi:hypothetical protein